MVKKLFYWEIKNNVNCNWNYIIMLLQYCNSITWNPGSRLYMLADRIGQ